MVDNGIKQIHATVRTTTKEEFMEIVEENGWKLNFAYDKALSEFNEKHGRANDKKTD